MQGNVRLRITVSSHDHLMLPYLSLVTSQISGIMVADKNVEMVAWSMDWKYSSCESRTSRDVVGTVFRATARL